MLLIVESNMSHVSLVVPVVEPLTGKASDEMKCRGQLRTKTTLPLLRLT